jgi:outer membrane protein assembly factor BamB
LSLAVVLAVGASAAAQVLPSGLIDPVAVRRFGLERQWASQVQLNPLADRVIRIDLYQGVLYVQTSASLLQAFEAETGKSLWTAHWGRPEYPSSPPAFSREHVGIVNGTRAYLASRADGALTWERVLAAAPAEGLAIGVERVFVPTYKGRIEAIGIADPKTTPKSLHLNGRPTGQPLLTAKRLCIATRARSLYLLDPNDLAEGARVETTAIVEAPLVYRAPHIFAASLDGYVYAIEEETGHVEWRASTATPIRLAPVLGLQDVFVVTEAGELVSIDLANGQELWRTSNVANVVASSSHRVYARDRFGRLVILDAGSGRRLGSFMAQEIDYAMPNSQNDRLYLASAGGIVQCLREADQAEPLVFAPAPVVGEVPAPPATTFPAAKPAGPATPKASAAGSRAASTPRASPRRPREPQERRVGREERGARGRAARGRGRGGEAPDGLPGALNDFDAEPPPGRRGREGRGRDRQGPPADEAQPLERMPGPPRRGPAMEADEADAPDALDDAAGLNP